MSRYIEEKDVIEGIRNNLDAGDYIYWYGGSVEDEVAEFPTADVAPVVHGEWVKDEEASMETLEAIYICSACHNFEAWGETEKYSYCPNCGARMDGVL